MSCFDYVSDGTKKCAYYASAGFCAKPWRVRCFPWLMANTDKTTIDELCSHAEFPLVDRKMTLKSGTGASFILNPKKAREAFSEKGIIQEFSSNLCSFSQIGCFAACPRRWWFRYVKRLRSTLEPHYFIVGKAGHRAVQRFLRGEKPKEALDGIYDDIGRKDVDPNDDLPSRLAGIKGLIAAWIKTATALHPDPADVEIERHIAHTFLPIHGYADVVIGGRDVWDLKFAGGSAQESPEHEAQVRLYMSMIDGAQTSKIVKLYKPDLRTKSNKIADGEEPNHVARRVYETVMRDPTKWLEAREYQRDPEKEAEVVDSLAFYARLIACARLNPHDLSTVPRRFGACIGGWSSCEYLDACKAEGRIDQKRHYVKGAEEDVRAEEVE